MRGVDALLLAFQTLTRFPVPSLRHAPDDPMVALSGIFYPLVGLVLGGVGSAVWSISSSLPPELAAALVWIALTFATGALHEDGLADAADALGSQKAAPDRLRVMKDSRIGTYGTVALILLYLVRWQALARSVAPVAALVASMTLSRAAVVGLAAIAGPAGQGTGGAFARAVTGKHAIGTALITALLAAPWYSRPLLAAAAACLFAAIIAEPYFRARLGGVTGDCLGSLAVVSEALTLLFFCWR